MKLIREYTEDVSVLQENIDGEKRYFIEGITMQADIKNRNSRKYPFEYLDREVRLYKENMIPKRRSLGEMEHPSTPKINLDRASHLFTEIKPDGKNFISKALVLNTPMGKILQEFVKDKITIGLSSRALGSLVEESGIKIVQSDLMLITPGDVVHDPSAPLSFVQGIQEGVEYEFINNKIVKKVQELIHTEHKITMSVEEKRDLLLKGFKYIINEITK